MAWLWIFFFRNSVLWWVGDCCHRKLWQLKGDSPTLSVGLVALLLYVCMYVCMYVCWLVVLLGIIGRHDKELFGRFIVPQGINVGHVLGRQFNVIRF